MVDNSNDALDTAKACGAFVGCLIAMAIAKTEFGSDVAMGVGLFTGMLLLWYALASSEETRQDFFQRAKAVLVGIGIALVVGLVFVVTLVGIVWAFT